jgi:hypothetical protein
VKVGSGWADGLLVGRTGVEDGLGLGWPGVADGEAIGLGTGLGDGAAVGGTLGAAVGGVLGEPVTGDGDRFGDDVLHAASARTRTNAGAMSLGMVVAPTDR